MKRRLLCIFIMVMGLILALTWVVNAQQLQINGSFTEIKEDHIAQLGTSYNEAPMLAAMVAAGLLPPVDERLPVETDIFIVDPVDGVGEYGGIWHNVTWWQGYGNILMILYDPPIRWKSDYSGYEPGLLKSWEMSQDGKTLTWHLREGVKWSDGVDFTTEDLQFWWEDLTLNENVGIVTIPWWGFNSDGTPMTVTITNTYTMAMSWDTPRFTNQYNIAQGYWEWLPLERPKHFLGLVGIRQSAP